MGSKDTYVNVAKFCEELRNLVNIGSRRCSPKLIDLFILSQLYIHDPELHPFFILPLLFSFDT